MVIVFRMVERILGVWREGGRNGRDVAESQGDALRGTWGTGDSKAQASLFAYGKTRQHLSLNVLQKTSHSAAST